MRYLVVEPHPDDLAFFCGGTVAKLIAEGHEVETLVMTDGEQGTLNRSYDTDDKLAAVMREEQRAACEVLGLDPLYVANEGKCLAIVAKEVADAVLQTMRGHRLGREAEIIGEVVDEHPGQVAMRTTVGGMRLVDMLSGDPLPRIC